jgi:nucleoside-diphosphate-sugar epimerase
MQKGGRNVAARRVETNSDLVSSRLRRRSTGHRQRATRPVQWSIIESLWDVMILITGVTGFVGQHLLRAMRSRFPGRPMRILSHTTPPPGALPDDVQVVLGDIADAKTAAEAVDGTHGVIHLAGKLQTNAHAIQEMRRVNAEGARNLYAAAVAAGVRLFVHMSSVAVYGPPRSADPFRENDACKPITPYQITKFEAEEALSQIDPKETILNILRPPGIYGPGSLLELAVYNKVLTRRWSIELSGGLIVHPTYVGDVVEAIIALVEKPAPVGTVFNIGGERPIPSRVLSALTAEILGVSQRSIVIPASIAAPFGGVAQSVFALIGRPRPLLAEMSRGRCFSSAVDDRRFRTCYPNVPVTRLADGLRKHIDWAREEHLLVSGKHE